LAHEIGGASATAHEASLAGVPPPVNSPPAGSLAGGLFQQGVRRVWSPARDAEASRLWAETITPTPEILEIVNRIDADIRLPVSTPSAIQERMQALKVRRCAGIEVDRQRGLRAAHERRQAEWQAKSNVAKAHAAAGKTRTQIAEIMGVHYKTVLGLLGPGGAKRAYTPPKPKTYAAPHPTAPKTTRRTFRAQTVEEFLAQGGQITRCPTVALLPTSAAIPAADCAAVAAYHAARTLTGSWKEQRQQQYRKAKAEGRTA
jgi:hypothetical protein